MHNSACEVGGNIHINLSKSLSVLTTDKAEDLSFTLEQHINTIIDTKSQEKEQRNLWDAFQW